METKPKLTDKNTQFKKKSYYIEGQDWPKLSQRLDRDSSWKPLQFQSA